MESCQCQQVIFLPSKFQSIEEENEIEAELEINKQNSPFRGGKNEQVKKGIHAPRQLQFSKIDTATHPPPMEVRDKIETNESHVNKSWIANEETSVPLSMRDGKLVIKIIAKDIRYQEEFWNSALIGYVLGDTPYTRSMDNYVTTVWNFVTKSKILYHDEGYYIFKFYTIEDRGIVMHTGPYTYHNKPFILKNREINFYFDPECLSTIPLWVKFPGLPMGYWSPEALSKLASGVRKSLYTDIFTAELEKISYARVLVETDVSQPISECIKIYTSFGVF
ncbi:uncharacterized protein [Nicotiana sylvestris]|uniref:uncharacterized protein n=1 Tax=Nicotiana sylvestris TaxID=4096 RepID=UPI00388C7A1F